MSYLAIFAMLKAVLFFFTLACLICFLSPMQVTFFQIRLKIAISWGFHHGLLQLLSCILIVGKTLHTPTSNYHLC